MPTRALGRDHRGGWPQSISEVIALAAPVRQSRRSSGEGPNGSLGPGAARSGGLPGDELDHFASYTGTAPIEVSSGQVELPRFRGRSAVSQAALVIVSERYLLSKSAGLR